MVFRTAVNDIEDIKINISLRNTRIYNLDGRKRQVFYIGDPFTRKRPGNQTSTARSTSGHSDSLFEASGGVARFTFAQREISGDRPARVLSFPHI